jgi:hypothetical protein
VLKFPNASESFKEANPHIFAEGTLGQILLEPKESEPTKAEIKSEKQLQDQIVGFLERNNVVVIRSRMDRKTSINVGTPDLLFSVRMRAVAFEVKLPGKKPTEEQRNLMLRMTGNGWACFIIHSYDEAVEVFKNISLP